MSMTELMTWLDTLAPTAALLGWGMAFLLWRRQRALQRHAMHLAADLQTREQYVKRRLAGLIGRSVQANDTVGGLLADVSEAHGASGPVPASRRRRDARRADPRWSLGPMAVDAPRWSLAGGHPSGASLAAVTAQPPSAMPPPGVARPSSPVPVDRTVCPGPTTATPCVATGIAVPTPPTALHPWVAVEVALARCAPVLRRAVAEVAGTDGWAAFDLGRIEGQLAVIREATAARATDPPVTAGEAAAILAHARMLDAVDTVLQADIRLRTYASRDLSLALLAARIGALSDAVRGLYAAHGYTIARPELLTRAGRLAADAVQVLYSGATRVLGLPEAARRIARLCAGGALEPTLAVDCDSFGLTVAKDGRLVRRTRLTAFNTAEWHRARHAVAR
jgi:hypothetical protein